MITNLQTQLSIKEKEKTLISMDEVTIKNRTEEKYTKQERLLREKEESLRISERQRKAVEKELYTLLQQGEERGKSVYEIELKMQVAEKEYQLSACKTQIRELSEKLRIIEGI